MYNHLLTALIKSFKNNDETAFEIIYGEFKGLINFYAKKLDYEDAVGELTLFFIELLCSHQLSKFLPDKSDSLKRYIAVSIRNKYIALSKQKLKRLKLNCNLFESDGYLNNFEDLIFIEDALLCLTESQRRIMIYKYVYSLSDASIADMLSISRQAVNRLKNRAMTELKKYYEI